MLQAALLLKFAHWLVSGTVFSRSNGLIIQWFNSMCDELKDVKYFKKITDFKNLIMYNTLKK